MSTADGSTDYYSSLANYFSNTQGARSQGKSGGAGGSAQQTPQSQSSSGAGSPGEGNTQGGNAQSGSNSWISAAVSDTTSNKASFVEPFSQQFGGISNNQVINSPNATGAVTTSPIAPITSDPSATGGGFGGIGSSPVELILAIFAGLALLMYLKR
jgi:hypothetical protein